MYIHACGVYGTHLLMSISCECLMVFVGPFIEGTHICEMNNMATVDLDWKLATGQPARAYTGIENIVAVKSLQQSSSKAPKATVSRSAKLVQQQKGHSKSNDVRKASKRTGLSKRAHRKPKTTKASKLGSGGDMFAWLKSTGEKAAKAMSDAIQRGNEEQLQQQKLLRKQVYSKSRSKQSAAKAGAKQRQANHSKSVSSTKASTGYGAASGRKPAVSAKKAVVKRGQKVFSSGQRVGIMNAITKRKFMRSFEVSQWMYRCGLPCL